MLIVGLAMRRRARASDLKGHNNGAIPLEGERGRERLALLQWPFQVLDRSMLDGGGYGS